MCRAHTKRSPGGFERLGGVVGRIPEKTWAAHNSAHHPGRPHANNVTHNIAGIRSGYGFLGGRPWFSPSAQHWCWFRGPSVQISAELSQIAEDINQTTSSWPVLDRHREDPRAALVLLNLFPQTHSEVMSCCWAHHVGASSTIDRHRCVPSLRSFPGTFVSLNWQTSVVFTMSWPANKVKIK